MTLLATSYLRVSLFHVGLNTQCLLHRLCSFFPRPAHGSTLPYRCPIAVSDSRRVPLLWCEIRLRSRVPIPQQEHPAFRAESFVQAQCLKLAPSRFLPLLATSTQFFPTCVIRRVSR